jgi:SAM-dependent methyltransferase
MNLRNELIKILKSVGPENIWRPVYDDDNVLLANGIADMRDGRPQDISKVDFNGKTVLDLGCNFGYYSFLAKQLGAQKVIGIDKDDRVIKGCNLLKAMHKIQDVYFYTQDFTNSSMHGTFDIVMLINFIGKIMVTEGIQRLLGAAERFSQNAIIISSRPYYRISKHLGGDTENIMRHYSQAYINNGRLYLLEFIHDYFHDNWDMYVTSPDDDCTSVKKTLLFTRK